MAVFLVCQEIAWIVPQPRHVLQSCVRDTGQHDCRRPIGSGLDAVANLTIADLARIDANETAPTKKAMEQTDVCGAMFVTEPAELEAVATAVGLSNNVIEALYPKVRSLMCSIRGDLFPLAIVPHRWTFRVRARVLRRLPDPMNRPLIRVRLNCGATNRPRPCKAQRCNLMCIT